MNQRLVTWMNAHPDDPATKELLGTGCFRYSKDRVIEEANDKGNNGQIISSGVAKMKEIFKPRYTLHAAATPEGHYLDSKVSETPTSLSKVLEFYTPEEWDAMFEADKNADGTFKSFRVSHILGNATKKEYDALKSKPETAGLIAKLESMWAEEKAAEYQREKDEGVRRGNVRTVKTLEASLTRKSLNAKAKSKMVKGIFGSIFEVVKASQGWVSNIDIPEKRQRIIEAEKRYAMEHLQDGYYEVAKETESLLTDELGRPILTEKGMMNAEAKRLRGLYDVVETADYRIDPSVVGEFRRAQGTKYLDYAKFNYGMTDLRDKESRGDRFNGILKVKSMHQVCRQIEEMEEYIAQECVVDDEGNLVIDEETGFPKMRDELDEKGNPVIRQRNAGYQYDEYGQVKRDAEGNPMMSGSPINPMDRMYISQRIVNTATLEYRRFLAQCIRTAAVEFAYAVSSKNEGYYEYDENGLPVIDEKTGLPVKTQKGWVHEIELRRKEAHESVKTSNPNLIGQWDDIQKDNNGKTQADLKYDGFREMIAERDTALEAIKAKVEDYKYRYFSRQKGLWQKAAELHAKDPTLFEMEGDKLKVDEYGLPQAKEGANLPWEYTNEYGAVQHFYQEYLEATEDYRSTAESQDEKIALYLKNIGDANLATLEQKDLEYNTEHGEEGVTPTVTVHNQFVSDKYKADNFVGSKKIQIKSGKRIGDHGLTEEDTTQLDAQLSDVKNKIDKLRTKIKRISGEYKIMTQGVDSKVKAEMDRVTKELISLFEEGKLTNSWDEIEENIRAFEEGKFARGAMTYDKKLASVLRALKDSTKELFDLHTQKKDLVDRRDHTKSGKHAAIDEYYDLMLEQVNAVTDGNYSEFVKDFAKEAEIRFGKVPTKEEIKAEKDKFAAKTGNLADVRTNDNLHYSSELRTAMLNSEQREKEVAEQEKAAQNAKVEADKKTGLYPEGTSISDVIGSGFDNVKWYTENASEQNNLRMFEEEVVDPLFETLNRKRYELIQNGTPNEKRLMHKVPTDKYYEIGRDNAWWEYFRDDPEVAPLLEKFEKVAWLSEISVGGYLNRYTTKKKHPDQPQVKMTNKATRYVWNHPEYVKNGERKDELETTRMLEGGYEDLQGGEVRSTDLDKLALKREVEHIMEGFKDAEIKPFKVDEAGNVIYDENGLPTENDDWLEYGDVPHEYAEAYNKVHSAIQDAKQFEIDPDLTPWYALRAEDDSKTSDAQTKFIQRAERFEKDRNAFAKSVRARFNFGSSNEEEVRKALAQIYKGNSQKIEHAFRKGEERKQAFLKNRTAHYLKNGEDETSAAKHAKKDLKTLINDTKDPNWFPFRTKQIGTVGDMGDKLRQEGAWYYSHFAPALDETGKVTRTELVNYEEVPTAEGTKIALAAHENARKKNEEFAGQGKMEGSTGTQADYKKKVYIGKTPQEWAMIKYFESDQDGTDIRIKGTADNIERNTDRENTRISEGKNQLGEFKEGYGHEHPVSVNAAEQRENDQTRVNQFNTDLKRLREEREQIIQQQYLGRKDKAGNPLSYPTDRAKYKARLEEEKAQEANRNALYKRVIADVTAEMEGADEHAVMQEARKRVSAFFNAHHQEGWVPSADDLKMLKVAETPEEKGAYASLEREYKRINEEKKWVDQYNNRSTEPPEKKLDAFDNEGGRYYYTEEQRKDQAKRIEEFEIQTAHEKRRADRLADRKDSKESQEKMEARGMDLKSDNGMFGRPTNQTPRESRVKAPTTPEKTPEQLQAEKDAQARQREADAQLREQQLKEREQAKQQQKVAEQKQRAAEAASRPAPTSTFDAAQTAKDNGVEVEPEPKKEETEHVEYSYAEKARKALSKSIRDMISERRGY